MNGRSAAAERDVREGGRWTPLQRVKNDLLFGLAIGALAVAQRLPVSASRQLGRGLGFLAWALVPGQRRLALANVALAMPHLPSRERHALVRRVFHELGTALGDVVATLDPRRAIALLPFLPASRDLLEAAIAEGRGVVFASAHLGPWERVAASLVASGIPLTVVAREPYDPRLGRVYSRLRGARGVRTVYRGAPGAGIALVRVLRRRGVLGVPMDLASRVPSIPVPFLGVPAPTPIGPARLAIRTGAAVVVGSVAQGTDGALGISFARIEASTSEAELTNRINAELSTRILALPHAWVWMHRRWPCA